VLIARVRSVNADKVASLEIARGNHMIGRRQVEQTFKHWNSFSRVVWHFARAARGSVDGGARSVCRDGRYRYGVPPLLSLLILLFPPPALAQSATHTVKLLTPEAALKVATAALEACRKQGYQVAAAVADRSGVTQVLLRDRFAGPHTVETAMNKAWTAITFRQDTLAFDIATSREVRAAGARMLPRIVPIGGGVLIEASGSVLGAVAVSGAPGGEADDHCARAGLAGIRSELEFEP
jgi:uncharacterized protein GlcG (DUF336 family)